jgi:hypothetical protein
VFPVFDYWGLVELGSIQSIPKKFGSRRNRGVDSEFPVRIEGSIRVIRIEGSIQSTESRGSIQSTESRVDSVHFESRGRLSKLNRPLDSFCMNRGVDSV